MPLASRNVKEAAAVLGTALPRFCKITRPNPWRRFADTPYMLCPLIYSTDLDGLTCKISFPLWHLTRRMLPTRPCAQEGPMIRRLIGLLVTLTVALSVL